MNRIKGRIVVDEGPLYKAKFPADLHGLYCKQCQKMYRKNELLENHMIVTFDNASKADEMKGMMPLLRAWAAFIDHFTGVKTTFTIGAKHGERNRRKKAKYGDGIMTSGTYNVIEVMLRDIPYAPEAGTVGYAYAQGTRAITLKTGVLVGLERNGPRVKTPGEALMYMVHEVTAHRFDVNFRHLGGDKKDLRKNATHYDSLEAHCESSKPGQNKCLNGFIIPSFPNAKNALPFFEKWYNDHKDDKLTMFKPIALKPAKPKPPKKKKKPAKPKPPKKKKERPVDEELLDEFEHGDAPLEDSSEDSSEDAGVPQAFLDAVPEIPEEAELEEVVEVD